MTPFDRLEYKCFHHSWLLFVASSNEKWHKCKSLPSNLGSSKSMSNCQLANPYHHPSMLSIDHCPSKILIKLYVISRAPLCKQGMVRQLTHLSFLKQRIVSDDGWLQWWKVNCLTQASKFYAKSCDSLQCGVFDFRDVFKGGV